MAENDHYLAFLDIMPLTKGHTLMIPKRKWTIFLTRRCDIVRIAPLCEECSPRRYAKQYLVNESVFAVLGMEVPHAHIHLVPMNSMGDVNFANPKLKLPRKR